MLSAPPLKSPDPMEKDVDRYFDRDAQGPLIEAEQKAIERGRSIRRGIPDGTKFHWTGLALSGGGIRSATFSLGVVQALARRDLLKNFDYISMVSGGGYLGASLQWWWRQAGAGLSPDSFPYGPGDVRDNSPPHADPYQTKILSFLRNHGNYLTPGNGINVWSALAVVMRTILLSVLVWLPLATLLCFISLAIDSCAIDPLARKVAEQVSISAPITSPLSSFVVANPAPVNTLASSDSNGARKTNDALTSQQEKVKQEAEQKANEKAKLQQVFALRTSYALLHWAVVAVAAVFCFFAVLFALLSGATESRGRASYLRIAVFGISGLSLLCWIIYRLVNKSLSSFTAFDWLTMALAAAIALMLMGRAAIQGFDIRIPDMPMLGRGKKLLNAIGRRLDRVEQSRRSGSYFFRRGLERQFGNWFVPWISLAVIGAVPIVPLYAVSHLTAEPNAWHVFAGLFSVASGGASAFYGYYTKLKNWRPGFAGQVFAPLGAAVFLFGTITIAYTTAVFVFDATFAGQQSMHIVSDQKLVWIVFVIASLVALLLGLFANVNHVGLHRFYRDRLMEVFMPDDAAVDSQRVSYSSVADLWNITDAVPFNETDGGVLPGLVPYPLVNTFAFLTDAKDGVVEKRGGDNFVISPLFIGSRITGWRSTDAYCEQYGALTVATAVAASGAAINSNAGYIGTGPTRDRLVSAAMTILNMRLGIWVANPFYSQRGFRKIPTYLFPMLTGNFLSQPDRSSRFVELSDGGNFENLGLYELVRRKLGLIVVVDGEADSTLAFPALVSVINRVREDFRATIQLSSLLGVDHVLPSAAITGYPAGAHFAKSPFMLGQITYENGKKGVLIYIKATLINNLDFTTYGYRAGSADFPHEGTEDQFFSVAQFEAYRDLGFVSGMQMIDETRLEAWINAIDEFPAPPAQVAGI